MQIDVTTEDIQAARDGDDMPVTPRDYIEAIRTAATCPVARAVCRALGYAVDDHRVLVHNGTIEVDCAEYPPPGVVHAFVFDFDLGTDVKPFSFEWDGPEVRPC